MNGTGLLSDVMSAICKFLCKIHGVRNDHNYSPMMHILFESQKDGIISDQEVINLLWTFLEELKDISEDTYVFPKKMRSWMDQKRPTKDAGMQTDPCVEMNDSKYVQITCDNSEFNRRINAFIKRKRAESDAFNCREFCRTVTDPNETSCARTDAIFVPRQSKKSLLKIEHVKNPDKRKEKVPLKLENLKAWPPAHPSAILPYDKLPSDVKERITSLKSVLYPNKSISQYSDVYEQLKNLESRVLYLESLSPEYFQIQSKNNGDNCDLMNTHAELIQQEPTQAKEKENDMLLDMRIKELREKLESRAKELREG